MDDVVNGGAGAGAGAGAADAGGGASAPVSDVEFLDQPGVAGGGSGDAAAGAAGAGDGAAAGASDAQAGAAAGKTPADASKEAASAEQVNLAALEEGRPEWFAKVTDASIRSEVEKLLDVQKAFGRFFKDSADVETFLTELPGGREEIAALQTMRQEIGELDTALEGNTPEGLANVAERYLGMAPDGGVGLLRAAAQHLAKGNPEAWSGLAGELIDSTLKGAGFGFDFNGLRQTIGEIREELGKGEQASGARFGELVGKLLGAPKTAAQEDPRIVKAREAETAARTAERNAQVQMWNRDVKGVLDQSGQHIRQVIGQALAKKDATGRPLIPASVPQDAREKLVERIYGEVDQQLLADRWFASQVQTLIGTPDKPLLTAQQEHFGKALELTKARVGKLLDAAVKKNVSAWARELTTLNASQREKARGGGQGASGGAGKAASNGGNGRKALTLEQMRDPKLSDLDFLNL